MAVYPIKKFIYKRKTYKFKEPLKIYINDVPYPLNNGYQYQSKNGQAIHQNMEG